MSRRFQRLIVVIVFVLAITAMVGSPAHASDGGGKVPGSPPGGHGHPLTISCYESSCNGQDPSASGCSSIAYKLGGDPTGMNVYWAPSPCDSNFGYVVAPSGNVVQEVQILRRNATTHAIDQVYTYCNSNVNCVPDHPNNGPLFIGNSATTWETDLVYAPVEQVKVVLTYGLAGSHIFGFVIVSIWH